MNTIKFIYYTDVHLQDNNPPSRVGDYKQDVLDKVQFVMDLAVKEKADFTYCGGDLFNHKKPMSNKHSLMVALIKVLASSGVPNYCVPGNHDLTNDRIDSLPEQPLGVLFAGGHMVHVDGSEVVTKGDLSVHLDSYPFEEEPDWESIAEKRLQTKADVYTLGAHVYSSPKGGDLFGTKIFSYKEMSVTDHDIYLLGHYHPDQGVVDTSFLKERQTFVNVGSLSRGDYGDENVGRKPKCVIVTISKDGEGNVTWGVEQVLVPIKPPEAVFDLERKEKIAKQKVEAAAFVADLKASSQRDEVRETEEEELAEITPDKKIFNRAMGFIERAREMVGRVTK